MYSRRHLGRLVLPALVARAFAAKKIDSTVDGIRFGLQSYVFSGLGLPADRVLDVVIASMVDAASASVIFSPH